MGNIEGITLTPLKIITGANGNVLHALKAEESSFTGFGEAYFSTVNHGVVKGWKKHQRMVLNLVVPVGTIQFVVYDGRADSPTYGQIQDVVLSPESNYQRLTVQPGLWMAFKGVSEELNMLLNLASIQHDPTEAENIPIENDVIPYHF